LVAIERYVEEAQPDQSGGDDHEGDATPGFYGVQSGPRPVASPTSLCAVALVRGRVAARSRFASARRLRVSAALAYSPICSSVFATSPVPPVWRLAPMPAPLSPLK